MNRLTLSVYHDGHYWVGKCRELDLVTSGPERWGVWTDLLNVCRAQVLFAVENDLTEGLVRA